MRAQSLSHGCDWRFCIGTCLDTLVLLRADGCPTAARDLPPFTLGAASLRGPTTRFAHQRLLCRERQPWSLQCAPSRGDDRLVCARRCLAPASSLCLLAKSQLIGTRQGAQSRSFMVFTLSLSGVRHGPLEPLPARHLIELLPGCLGQWRTTSPQSPASHLTAGHRRLPVPSSRCEKQTEALART